MMNIIFVSINTTKEDNSYNLLPKNLIRHINKLIDKQVVITFITKIY